MDLLKLIALDADDLSIVSAYVQDALTKVGDVTFRPAEKQFILPLRRFVWEREGGRLRKPHNERRNSVLHFDRVLGVKATGIDRAKKDEVLSLLAIQFEAGDMPAGAPGGAVDLVFAASATIRLEVEVVEARLTDLGGAWEATSRPDHKV